MGDAPTTDDVVARLPFDVDVSVHPFETEPFVLVGLEDPHGAGLPVDIIIDGSHTPMTLGARTSTELYGSGDTRALEQLLSEVLGHRAVERVGRRGSRVDLLDEDGRRVRGFVENRPPRRSRGVERVYPPYRPRP